MFETSIFLSFLGVRNCIVRYVMKSDALPIASCSCCGRIRRYYQLGAVPLNLLRNSSFDFLNGIGLEDSFFRRLFPLVFCQRCLSCIKTQSIPRVSKNNGFRSRPIPSCLRSLSAIEERMVSPIVSAFQFVRSPVVTQPKICGPMIECPLDPLSTFTQVLPRDSEHLHFVEVQFVVNGSRYSKYPVIRDRVNMKKVYSALEYLLSTELFQSLGIVCDTDYFAYGGQFNNILHLVPSVGSVDVDPQQFSTMTPRNIPYRDGLNTHYELLVNSGLRRDFDCSEMSPFRKLLSTSIDTVVLDSASFSSLFDTFGSSRLIPAELMFVRSFGGECRNTITVKHTVQDIAESELLRSDFRYMSSSLIFYYYHWILVSRLLQ